MARALGQKSAVLLPLPDQDKLLVGEIGEIGDRTGATFIWADERATIISRQATDLGQSILPVAASPDEELVVMSVSGDSVVPYSLLEAAACRDRGECEMRALLGVPIWSIDGQHTLLERNIPGNDVDSLIFTGDAFGESVTLLGEGRFPFWLDEQRIGYVSQDNIVLSTTLSTINAQPLVNLSDLLPLVPDSATTPAGHYVISYAGFSRQYNTLLLNVTDIAGVHYIVEYPLATGVPELHFSWQTGPGLGTYEAALSPNGRWLTIVGFSDEQHQWTLHYFDLETGVTHVYPLGVRPPQVPPHLLVDWSADGNWMVVSQGGYLRFIAPESEYERWLILDRMACDQAVWGP